MDAGGRSILTLVVVCIVGAACSPTGLCGCSPIEPSAVIGGFVETVSGSPLPGVGITANIKGADCTSATIQIAGTQSSGSGAYGIEVYPTGADSACVELTAIRGDSVQADTIVREVVVTPGIPQPPPVRLDLIFPN